MLINSDVRLKWTRLLIDDPGCAVNKLIRNEINADPTDSKDDPAFNLKLLTYNVETENHSRILALVDMGLSLWFKGVKDSPTPPRWAQFSRIARIRHALRLVERFTLPQTKQLLLGAAWFDALQNDTDLKHPKQIYQEIVLSKGN